ncbi:acyl-CoA N-acyltransferase [Lichtheimia hyalospora FSU 10163]|nr:acyl-CoA N-acyltransferase [Lichtheimia hyalospora FSU 10163]
MSSAYGKIPKPVSDGTLNESLPLRKTLRNGQEATLQAVDPTNPDLVKHLHSLFNGELERGSTYPQEEPLDAKQFEDYFLAYDSFVLVKGGPIEADKEYDYEDKVLGMYYVKPNYPGRCSHICNGGFFTSPMHRGYGAGVAMAETFLITAPGLGYKASVFNLVFANNEASIRIWERLGFSRVGCIPQAARLKNSPDQLVDAYIYHMDFSKLKNTVA